MENALTDISPKDKPWDKHKSTGDSLRDMFKDTIHDRYAGRVNSCSGYLSFREAVDHETGEKKLKLWAARFCRVRLCPVCQWRRSLGWKARFHKAVPKLLEDYPKARFILLTLTVRNCPVDELRDNLTRMNTAWDKLVKRKAFPAIGFFKSVEVTRNNDPTSEWYGTAHPHFHVLMMVNPGYFGRDYLTQKDWAELWQKSLRVSYQPMVNVKIVKPKGGKGTVLDIDSLMNCVKEVLKYTVKEEELIIDKEWIIKLATELHKTRAISVGGVFKEYLSEEDVTEEEMTQGEDNDESLEMTDERWFFGWREQMKRYIKVESTD